MITTIKGQRVADAGSPEFMGTVVTPGAQVSVVKWDDPKVRGAEQAVANEHLIEEVPPVDAFEIEDDTIRDERIDDEQSESGEPGEVPELAHQAVSVGTEPTCQAVSVGTEPTCQAVSVDPDPAVQAALAVPVSSYVGMTIEQLLAIYANMGREMVRIGIVFNPRPTFPSHGQAVAACCAARNRIHIRNQEAAKQATKRKENEMKKAKRATDKAPKELKEPKARKIKAPRVAKESKIRALKADKPPKAAKAPKEKEARVNGNGHSKTALVGEMLLRKGGCTSPEILEATGWPAVSVPAIAKANNLDLRKEKVGRTTTYFGTLR